MAFRPSRQNGSMRTKHHFENPPYKLFSLISFQDSFLVLEQLLSRYPSHPCYLLEHILANQYPIADWPDIVACWRPQVYTHDYMRRCMCRSQMGRRSIPYSVDGCRVSAFQLHIHKWPLLRGATYYKPSLKKISSLWKILRLWNFLKILVIVLIN